MLTHICHRVYLLSLKEKKALGKKKRIKSFILDTSLDWYEWFNTLFNLKNKLLSTFRAKWASEGVIQIIVTPNLVLSSSIVA